MPTTEPKVMFDLHFGGLSDTISQQLKSQKIKFAPEKIKRFQLQADALVTLRLGDLLSDSDHRKIQQKLFNKIEKHIQQNNKP